MSQESLSRPHRRGKNVVIIGAGIAGISAAARLIEAFPRRGDFQIQMIEGNSRIGGRIHTQKSKNMSLELGAQWIHGINGNPLYQLANRYGVSTIPCSLNRTLYFDHQSRRQVEAILSETRKSPSVEDQFRSELISKAKVYRDSLPLSGRGSDVDLARVFKELVESSSVKQLQKKIEVELVKEFLSPWISGSVNSMISKLILSSVWKWMGWDQFQNLIRDFSILSGFGLESGISADEYSLKRLFLDYPEYLSSLGGENIVTGGYENIPVRLFEESKEYSKKYQGPELSLHLNTKVTQVKMRGSKSDSCFQLNCKDEKGEFILSADYVIIAVPLGVLQSPLQKRWHGRSEDNNYLQLNPQPSSAFLDGLSNLQMSLLSKVFVFLKKQPSQAPTFSQMYSVDRQSYEDGLPVQWISKLHENPDGRMFMGLTYGNGAQVLEQNSHHDFYQRKLCAQIRDLLRDRTIEIDHVISTSHSNNPFAYGAYSFPKVGATSSTYDALKHPWLDVGQVVCAGEHTVERENENLNFENSRGLEALCPEVPLIFRMPSMAHGAYWSGIRAARQIEKYLLV